MAAIPELDRSLESAYRAHYPALFRRARRWLPPDEAEDLVQETFLRAWMHHGGSDPGVPWLMTVLRNLAIDRSRRIHPDLTDDPRILDADGGDGTEEKVVALEERRQVRDALATLTAQQRAVITLREWAGMSQQEIANSLHTTVPSVESLLLRGRRRLKKVLGHAMAAVLWPTSEAWRRLKGGLVAQSAGGSGAASSWSSTVAGFATAATVMAAGAAAPLGPAHGAPPPPRDPIVAWADGGSTAGAQTTPTERAAGSGPASTERGTVGSGGGSSSASTTSDATTGDQTTAGDGSRLSPPGGSSSDGPVSEDRARLDPGEGSSDEGPATTSADNSGTHADGDEDPGQAASPPTVGVAAPDAETRVVSAND